MSPLNFRLKLGHSETPNSKAVPVSRLAGTLSSSLIKFLIYLKAIYGQEMTGIDFSSPATKSRVSSIIPDSRS